MKSLVTGGCGFLGSHLVDLLVENGHDVTVVDNMSTNVVQPRDDVRFRDVPIREYIETTTNIFDQVYHLASVVGPVGVLDHAGRIIESVVNDTYAIAEYCNETNARLLDVSTSEIYGGGQQGYCTEDMPKIITHKTSARLEYAIAKLAAETALINLGYDAIIIRPFNITGPRQKPDGGFVLPRFINQALAGEPLTVYGDGTQVRAMTHVKDVAQGIFLAMQRGKAGQAYNIGNPLNKVTILELAEKVIEITGSSSEIQFVDPKTLWGDKFEEAADKYPDPTKAFKELRWKPEFDLAQIIKDCL